jgi:hypothetical protein
MMVENDLNAKPRMYSTASFGSCAQADMPPRYPPYHTCHRWFQKWAQDGVFKQILTELAEDLYERGGIDIRETFIGGSFTPAKMRAVLSTIQSVAKAPRSWQLQTLVVFLSPLTYKALHLTK